MKTVAFLRSSEEDVYFRNDSLTVKRLANEGIKLQHCESAVWGSGMLTVSSIILSQSWRERRLYTLAHGPPSLAQNGLAHKNLQFKHKRGAKSVQTTQTSRVPHVTLSANTANILRPGYAHEGW